MASDDEASLTEQPEQPEVTPADLMKMIISHQEFLKTLGSHKTSRTSLVKPRIGGEDITGMWTGHGASGLQKEPTSTHCMRMFDTDVLKNHQAMAPIQDFCKKGLRDSPELLFCMSDEPNAGTIVPSIRALEDHIIDCGMEGVFQIVTRDSSGVTTTLNMLHSPGMLTDDMVDKWCQDVMTAGVPTSGPSSPASPVCPHDRTNMLWSADAILASCTETFRQDLKLCVPQPRYGPKLLMVIINKRFRPSLANGRVLLDRLGFLDIRKYPGENVTLFVQDATKIVREIQMTFMSSNPMPELTMTALTGLTNSTDGMLLLASGSS